jgi:hypothetical protein
MVELKAGLSIFKSFLPVLANARNLIISNKSNELKEEEVYLIKREQNATYLKKYSENLIEQKRRVDPIFDELANACRNSLGQIALRTDTYSQSSKNCRRNKATRHLFCEILGNLFNAFSYEMTWQTTLSLYSRFRKIVDLQEDYVEFDTKKKRIDILSLYEKQNCCSLEGKLFNTKRFVDLLSDFFETVTSSDELHQKVLADAEPVFTLIRKHRDTLKSELLRIELLRDENNLEEFKIADSYDLDKSYKLLERKLAFIEESFLIEQWAKYDTKEIRLSQVLIIGFLLIMIDRHKLWGQYVGI